ncbi:MAG: phosphate regulon transcriptional regulatory protein PhoB [uncultured bacterium]|nr:MAG: phosphate regulon transcriptional regulatory protein PhoB [uncultured bacterium]
MNTDNKKILVAEDDEFLIKAYKAKLEQEGFEILLATDGEEAVSLVNSENPSVILLDVMMPKISGFEVLETVRKNPATKDIPVIIMSNLGQESDVKKGLNLGAQDYLIKSNLDMDQIVTKIRKYIG